MFLCWLWICCMIWLLSVCKCDKFLLNLWVSCVMFLTNKYGLRSYCLSYMYIYRALCQFSMVVYLYFTLTIYTCQHCAVLVDMLYITINWIVLKMLLSLKLSLSITRFKYDPRSYCHSYMYMALCQFSMVVYLYFTLTIYTCQHCCPCCHAIYNN